MIIKINTNEPAEYTFTKAVSLITNGSQATMIYLTSGDSLSEITFPITAIVKFQVWSNEN